MKKPKAIEVRRPITAPYTCVEDLILETARQMMGDDGDYLLGQQEHIDRLWKKLRVYVQREAWRTAVRLGGGTPR